MYNAMQRAIVQSLFRHSIIGFETGSLHFGMTQICNYLALTAALGASSPRPLVSAEHFPQLITMTIN